MATESQRIYRQKQWQKRRADTLAQTGFSLNTRADFSKEKKCRKCGMLFSKAFVRCTVCNQKLAWGVGVSKRSAHYY